MGFEEYFQPPFSVFFLWAIFLGIVVLFHPIKTVVKKIFLCLGWTWCAAEEVDGGVEERARDNDRHGHPYAHLSADRKLEIDNLRTITVLKYLSDFTLTLKKENMTTLESAERQIVVESVEQSEIIDTETVSGSDVEADIEKGFPNERVFESHENSKLEIMECSGELTHVLIPLPGQRSSEQELRNETSEPNNKSWYPSLPQIKAPQDKASSNGASAENATPKITERYVPIFCAVCLMEYELADRVCWSSNKECTHVFHEDCIVQWLVSSGRTKSKRRWFPDNPSENKLMCYELECPCCRQEFISKEARTESAEDGV